MSFRRRKSYGYYDFYPPQPTKAEKMARNASMLARLKKGRDELHPVMTDKRAIGATFWGKAWCDNLKVYEDCTNRLGRGRSYLREGAVLDLQIAKGRVTALVAGSARKPYEITIDIKPLSKERWSALKRQCAGKISSLLSLIQGKLPDELIRCLCDRENGIFPQPDEISMFCSCPDYSSFCKHLVAAMYGVGLRLDQDPAVFFTLRVVDASELLSMEAVEQLAAPPEDGTALDDGSLASTFGVDFDDMEAEELEGGTDISATPTPPSRTKEARQAAAATKPAAGRPAAATKPVVADDIADVAVRWTPEAVRRLRSDLGLNQKDFAAFFKVTGAYVSQWENGRVPVPEKFYPILQKLLDDLLE